MSEQNIPPDFFEWRLNHSEIRLYGGLGRISGADSGKGEGTGRR
jgi:hypothetical protein